MGDMPPRVSEEQLPWVVVTTSVLLYIIQYILLKQDYKIQLEQ